MTIQYPTNLKTKFKKAGKLCPLKKENRKPKIKIGKLSSITIMNKTTMRYHSK